jgi:septal ring factor EnvC (AmiA/AmiB activator)
MELSKPIPRRLIMVVRTSTEYMNDQLANRVKSLQKALNQAEKIMNTLELENQRLKDALSSLASENNKGYILNNEAFNEPVLTV